MNENWVIAGKPDDAIPTVGQLYEIRDSRKGTFTGRIISVSGYFAKTEVVSGKIYWASKENHIFNRNPRTVNIRASLVYLIKIDEAELEAESAAQLQEDIDAHKDEQLHGLG